MTDILGLLINANSLQTLILLTSIICGYILLNSKIDRKFVEFKAEIKKEIDEKFAEIKEEINAKFVKIDEKFEEQDSKIESRFAAFYEKLKTNDFAHIHDAINSLVFLIKRNGQINDQDEKFVKEQLTK